MKRSLLIFCAVSAFILSGASPAWANGVYLPGVPHYNQDYFPGDGDCVPNAAGQVLGYFDAHGWPRMVYGCAHFEHNSEAVSHTQAVLKNHLDWWSNHGTLSDWDLFWGHGYGSGVADAANEMDGGADWDYNDDQDPDWGDMCSQIQHYGPYMFTIWTGNACYAYYGSWSNAAPTNVVQVNDGVGHCVACSGYCEGVYRVNANAHWVIVDTGWNHTEPAWINHDVDCSYHATFLMPDGDATRTDNPVKPRYCDAWGGDPGHIEVDPEDPHYTTIPHTDGVQCWDIYRNTVSNFTTATLMVTNVYGGWPDFKIYSPAQYYYWVVAKWFCPYNFTHGESVPSDGMYARGTPFRYSVNVTITPTNAGTYTLTPPPAADGTYEHDSVVQLMAWPQPGYYFSGFSGDANGISLQTLSMTSNKHVTASFVQNTLQKPTAPNPSDCATSQPLDNVILSWRDGGGAHGAVNYEVYFEGRYMGTFDDTHRYFPVSGLWTGTTYHWYVRVVSGPFSRTGDTWTFTTISSGGTVLYLPNPASAPQPPNNSTNVPREVILSWTGGGSSYDVYFNGGFYTNTTATNLSMSGLDYNQTCTWKVDSRASGGIRSGAFWTFQTMAMPVDLSAPLLVTPCNCTNISANTGFTWINGGSGAAAFRFTLLEAAGDLVTNYCQMVRSNSFQPPARLDYDRLYMWRVDSINGDYEVDSVFGTFRTETAPPAPPPAPMALSPADGQTNVATSLFLVWSGSASASGYGVYLNSRLMGFTGQTSLLLSNLNREQTYLWTVIATNRGGATTSAVWSFTTVPNLIVPPPQAVAISPTDGAVSVPLDAVLSWEPEPTSTNFLVYFKGVLMGGQAGTNFSPGHLNYGQTYSWRIDSQNSAGITTGAVWTFTTLAQPMAAPAKVIVIAPANGASGISTEPVLSWQAVTNADSYDVYFNGVFVTNQSTLAFSPGRLAWSSSYTWRVDSRNKVGLTTGDLWSFVTAVPRTYPPSQVLNPTPTNGSTGLPVNLTLSWEPAAGAAVYDVYFNGVYMGEEKDTNFTVSSLDYNTTYFWEVDAKNAGGLTAGDLWLLTTTNAPTAPPDKPQKPLPTDGLAGASTEAVLSWSPAANADSYVVMFDGAYMGSQTWTVFKPGPLVPGKTYAWQVIAQNSAGTTASDKWSFTTMSSAAPALPGVPVNPVPSTGFVDTPVNVTLGWTPCDAAQTYDIYLNGVLLTNQSAAVYAVAALAYNQTYNWQVIARNETGTSSSDVWYFTTEASAPPPPRVVPVLIQDNGQLKVRLLLQGLAGKNCLIEYCDDLTGQQWHKLLGPTVTANEFPVDDPDLVQSRPCRFYRVSVSGY